MNVSTEKVRDHHLENGWHLVETVWPPVSESWSLAGKAMDEARCRGIEVAVTAAEPGYWATATKHPDWTTGYCHGQESGPRAVALAIDQALPLPAIEE